MLRLIEVGNSLPVSFICDPSAEFQAGSVAELVIIGNQVMATVSNGTCPIGIIDDVKTKAFTNVSWNETVIVPAIGVPGPNNTLVTPVDIMKELRRPNIIPRSFTSTVSVTLNPINGIITFIAGTPLNIDLSGTGTPNAIKAIVNYTYQVANIPGDDSTAGSGRVTVWFQRMFFQTDQFESNQVYPLRANLYVNEVGLFTTRRPGRFHPAVAVISAPPTPMNIMLEALWL
jgi:hypothetical protein